MLKRLTGNKKNSHHVLRDRVAQIKECCDTLCEVACDGIHVTFYVLDNSGSYQLNY